MSDVTEKEKEDTEIVAAHQQDMKRTAELLGKQKKVRLTLRQLTKEQGGPLPDETVCINGHIYQIKRGEEVFVPQSVADVLAQAGRI